MMRIIAKMPADIFVAVWLLFDYLLVHVDHVRMTDPFQLHPQAFQVIKLFLESLEKHSENVMSDSAQQEHSGAG